MRLASLRRCAATGTVRTDTDTPRRRTASRSRARARGGAETRREEIYEGTTTPPTRRRPPVHRSAARPSFRSHISLNGNFIYALRVAYTRAPAGHPRSSIACSPACVRTYLVRLKRGFCLEGNSVDSVGRRFGHVQCVARRADAKAGNLRADRDGLGGAIGADDVRSPCPGTCAARRRHSLPLLSCKGSRPDATRELSEHGIVVHAGRPLRGVERGGHGLGRKTVRRAGLGQPQCAARRFYRVDPTHLDEAQHPICHHLGHIQHIFFRRQRQAAWVRQSAERERLEHLPPFSARDAKASALWIRQARLSERPESVKNKDPSRPKSSAFTSKRRALVLSHQVGAHRRPRRHAHNAEGRGRRRRSAHLVRDGPAG